MSIENFIWDSKNQSVSWSFNGKTILKRFENAYFATHNTQKNYVYVEAGQNFSQDQIYYFSLDGTQIFTIDKMNNKVNWQIKDELVEINCHNILNAQLYIEQSIVIIISAENQNEKVMKGFALDGELLFIKDPPRGFTFNYLATFRNQPSIVCDGDKSNADEHGRSSWHFIINAKTGDISKENLAY